MQVQFDSGMTVRAVSAGLVGRQSERDLLRAAIQAPDVGGVIVRGPAGVGKTALAEALVAEAQASGALVGIGKYAEGHAHAPFAPVVAALSQIVSQALDLLYDPAAGLESLGEGLGPALGVLSQAGFRVDGVPILQAAELSAQREGAVRLVSAALKAVDWLRGFGAPIVILVDDWRRASPDVRRLIMALLARSAQDGLTLLLTERDDLPPDPLAERPDVAEVELPELRPADSLALFAAGLGSDSAAATVAEWLGPDFPRLPFDILETARSIRDSGAVLETGSGWAVAPERLAESDRPNIAHTIVRRLQAASRESRRLATALALWGDSGPAAGLACALGLDEAALRLAASGLESAGLLRRQGGSLQFRHDRLRALVLEAAGPDRQARIAAEMAERLGAAGRDGEWLEPALRLRLAAGTGAAEAAVWRDRFARGAVEARARADGEAAGTFGEIAWDLLGRAGPGDRAAERLAVRAAVLAAADRKDAAEVSSRARRLIEMSQGPRELGDSYETGINALRVANDHEGCWSLGREGMRRFGVRTPAKATRGALVAAMLRFRLARMLAPRRFDLEEEGEEVDAFTRIAHAAGSAVYERDATTASLMALKGLARVSGSGRQKQFWLGVETYICASTGELKRAAALAEEAVARPDPLGVGRSATLYRAVCWGLIWRRPLAELRRRCAEARDIAIAEGDLVSAATAIRNGLVLAWRSCPSLATLDEEVRDAERELDWLGEPTAKILVRQLGRIVQRLRDGRPAGLIELAREFARLQTVELLPIAPVAIELASLSGDWPAAAALGRTMAPLKRTYDSRSSGGVIWRFHESLWRLKAGAPPPEADLRYIRRAGRLNPFEYRHKVLILEAERRRREGRTSCLSAYALAVEAAAASSSRLDAGLAAELAADAAREFGRPSLAEQYAARAQEIWTAWGAGAKLWP